MYARYAAEYTSKLVSARKTLTAAYMIQGYGIPKQAKMDDTKPNHQLT